MFFFCHKQIFKLVLGRFWGRNRIIRIRMFYRGICFYKCRSKILFLHIMLLLSFTEGFSFKEDLGLFFKKLVMDHFLDLLAIFSSSFSHSVMGFVLIHCLPILEIFFPDHVQICLTNFLRLNSTISSDILAEHVWNCVEALFISNFYIFIWTSYWVFTEKDLLVLLDGTTHCIFAWQLVIWFRTDVA